MSLVLRDYQARALDEARARVRAGRRAPLLVSPTGSGKTVMAAEVVRAHLNLRSENRALVLAHRKELIEQLATTMRRAALDVGEIRPGAPSIDARVQVASTQTLRARGELPVGVTLVIFDEAHHYAADDWSELTKAYPDALRIGFTATPCRSDCKGLSPAFDSLVVVATIAELTKAGHLVPCRVVAPEKPLKRRELVCSPLQAYVAHAAGRRTVVFAEFVSDAESYAAEFRAAGVEAVVVHGELPAVAREEALRAHREDGAVLVNCMVLTEGWDSPETSVCILARGCGSVGTYLQIVGRVLRPAPGKAEAVLVDLTGRATWTHGPPDEERVFSLTGAGIRSANRATGSTCFVCGSLVDSWPCDVCGHQPEGEAAGPLRIVGGDLAERFADKRKEDTVQRLETLTRWMAEASANGHKPWSAVYKYERVYGYKPCRSLIFEAELRAKKLECFTCTACLRATVKTYGGGRCGRCTFGNTARGRAA